MAQSKRSCAIATPTFGRHSGVKPNPPCTKVAGAFGSSAGREALIDMVQQGRPRCGRCPGQVVPDGTRFGSAAVRPDHRMVSADRITDTAANQDGWYVLARAGTDVLRGRWRPRRTRCSGGTCRWPGRWPPTRARAVCRLIPPTPNSVGWRPSRAGLAVAGQRRGRGIGPGRDRSAAAPPARGYHQRRSGHPAPGGWAVTDGEQSSGRGQRSRENRFLHPCLVLPGPRPCGHVRGVSVRRRPT